MFLLFIFWSSEFIMMVHLSVMEKEAQKQFQGFCAENN